MFHYLSDIIIIILLCYSLTSLTTEESITTSILSHTTSTPYPSSSILPSSIQHTSTAVPIMVNTPNPQVRQYSCICDVTLLVCDANCCCDIDCSEDIITNVFTCSISDSSTLSQSCVRTDDVYIFNTIGTFIDGILCVQINNNPSAIHYTQPLIVSDLDTFQIAIDSYGSDFTYPELYMPLNEPVFYRLGDPICALITDNTAMFPSLFSLPQGVNSKTCNAYSPVAFYTSFSSGCSQQFGSIESACQRGSVFDATQYTKLRIFKLPSCYNDVITNYTALTHSIQLNCIDSNGNTIICPLSMYPVYNRSDNSCYPALSSIAFIIATNGTDGISSITATVYLTRLRVLSLPLEQSYSIIFSSVTDAETQESLSGNPGYLDTRPVIVANLLSTTDIITSLLPQSLTILQSNVNCNVSKQTIVGFRDNSNSGCVYSVNIADLSNRCTQLQQETRSLLLGNGPHTHVAMYGNSKLYLDSTELWVNTIFEEIAIPTLTESGCKLYTNLNIQILYASNGTSYKPDRSIRSLKYTLYYSLFSSISCIDYVCDFQDNVNKISLTTTVDFIDISQAPIVMKRVTPGTTNILPDDFFYPFFVSAATGVLRLQTFLLIVPVMQYMLII
ncbi:hypothetical protein LOD99_15669 [Oopsacas minuta]|uniref:Tectonic domain-containing protein n=1 Tax=Oopsacas minuta TaxID=111878 RepID=A0AAV7K9E7_9METZ|nr:hypothetical protein LOD99_15669 [Oopsacas minuta]